VLGNSPLDEAGHFLSTVGRNWDNSGGWTKAGLRTGVHPNHLLILRLPSYGVSNALASPFNTSATFPTFLDFDSIFPSLSPLPSSTPSSQPSLPSSNIPPTQLDATSSSKIPETRRRYFLERRRRWTRRFFEGGSKGWERWKWLLRCSCWKFRLVSEGRKNRGAGDGEDGWEGDPLAMEGTEADWEAGDRRVVVVLYSISSRVLIRSLSLFSSKNAMQLVQIIVPNLPALRAVLDGLGGREREGVVDVASRGFDPFIFKILTQTRVPVCNSSTFASLSSFERT